MNVWLTRAALRIRGLPPSARVVLLPHVDACAASGRCCLRSPDGTHPPSPVEDPAA